MIEISDGDLGWEVEGGRGTSCVGWGWDDCVDVWVYFMGVRELLGPRYRLYEAFLLHVHIFSLHLPSHHNLARPLTISPSLLPTSHISLSIE